MDKSAERILFDHVYGRVKDWEVVPSEAPDFLCKRNGSTVLGVEVTELWQNESLARLNYIGDYALDLLDGGNFRHKDDKKTLKVGPIKYLPGGQEDKAFEVNAIGLDIPGRKERVSLLEEIIKSKAQKASTYAEICPEIDLLIADSSNLFTFDKYEEIFYPISLFANRPTIMDSSFREIFLTTKTKEAKKEVFIPLKLNLFFEDIFLFEGLVAERRDLKRQWKKAFQVILSCMCLSGYGELPTCIENDEFGIIVGCHLYSYSSAGRQIRDCLPIPEKLVPGVTIRQISSDAGKSALKIASKFLEKRRDREARIPLYFEAGSGIPAAGGQNQID
jgi:hypothetical protein